MNEPSDLRKPPTSDARPVGIDLGTTNSAVAWVDSAGRTAMVTNADGEILTPSIVLFRDSDVVVGKEARRSTTIEPQRVAEWVKRDMGSPVYSHPIQGEYLPPEVIQACILRKLKVDLVGTLGPNARVVITVPAYFDETRRKATADAGEMAGLNLLDIVNEPTAAALAFGETIGYLSPIGDVRDEMTVLVYDLGGGTFDVTLLRMAPGDIQCLATDGDVQLGGHDWDQRLVDHLAEAFKARHSADPREDPVGLNRLFQLAVDAKHALSARSRTTARVDHAGRSLDVPITRDQFEEMTADLLERTLHTTRQVLAEMKMRFSDVNRLLLVGGSTRMPIVASRLQAMTGLTPERSVNPDEAVARGAALYARYLLAKEAAAAGAGKPDTGFTVTNVNAHSLGIEGIDPATLRKTNVKLIPRNTPLPAAFTEKFTTRSENQRSIIIQILQGENTLPEECTPIGRTAVENLPEGLPKGWPVEVTFEYESNGRLTVRAVVPGTHRETTLKLERTTGLSSEGLGHWREVVESAAGFDAFEALIQEALEEQITPLAPAAVSSPSPSQPVPPGGSRPMRSAPMAPMAPPVLERLPPASAGLDGNGGARGPVHPASRESHPTMPGTGAQAEPFASESFAAESVEVPSNHRGAPRGSSGARRWLSILLFYVTSAAVGSALAYYVLSRWHPEEFPLPW